MRKWLILGLVFFPFGLNANEAVKKKLLHAHKALQSELSEEKKSQLYFELALAYYQDQENDQAFYHFLEALKYMKKMSAPEMDISEKKYYVQALGDYLNCSGKDPALVAEELLQKYAEIGNQNPHFLQLNFLLATAYGNLGRYDDFFSRFYNSFPYLHDTFLAYKTQGILYLRLSHHGKSVVERQHFQEEAIRHLDLALNRNPEDASLYKVLIFLAKDEKNKKLIQSYLQQMVENKVVCPRSDIYLYVTEAVSINEYELAQEMIDLAKSYYEYSRAIAAAQTYLNQHKK